MTTSRPSSAPQEAADPAPVPSSPVRGEATGYDVRCVIDVVAASPAEAAWSARLAIREPGPPAGVFIVTELNGEPGAQWRIDLGCPGSEPEVLRTREEARLIAATGLDAATGPFSPAAPARIRDLHAAPAAARQALAGDSYDAEHDALYGLAEVVAAFAGEEAS